ncbi:LppU family putative lipoprotein [Nocardia sp. NPDC055321]
MSRQQISARIAASVIAAATVLLAGCGDITDGSPLASLAADPPPPPTSPPPTRPVPKTATAEPADANDKGGVTGFDAAVGDCVRLGGTMTDATIVKATCGATDANYKVIAKAPTNDQCPGDADQAYFRTIAGVETGALCLDIDWVVGDCMDLGSDNPARIDCSAKTGKDAVRVLAIMRGTSDVNDCTVGGRGYTYAERKLVVCVSAL